MPMPITIVLLVSALCAATLGYDLGSLLLALAAFVNEIAAAWARRPDPDDLPVR